MGAKSATPALLLVTNILETRPLPQLKLDLGSQHQIVAVEFRIRSVE